MGLKSVLFVGFIVVMFLVIAGCAGAPKDNAQPSPVVVVSPAPGPLAPAFSASDPGPVNATAEIRQYNDGGSGYYGRLTLLETLSGAPAEARLKKDVSPYYTDIPADREYFFVRFRYELVDISPAGATLPVNRTPFQLYRNGQFDPKDNINYAGPQPDFYSTGLKKGEAVEGWIAFTVPKSNSIPPLIVYERNSTGGGIWFRAGG